MCQKISYCISNLEVPGLTSISDHQYDFIQSSGNFFFIISQLISLQEDEILLSYIYFASTSSLC